MSRNILMPIMIFMIKFYNSSRFAHRAFVFHHFNHFSLYLILAFAILFSVSCEKGILKEGADLLPSGDLVSIMGSDTLHAFSYLRYDDSVRTDNPTISYLGQNFSPYFGTSSAGFVTQIRLSQKSNKL